MNLTNYSLPSFHSPFPILQLTLTHNSHDVLLISSNLNSISYILILTFDPSPPRQALSSSQVAIGMLSGFTSFSSGSYTAREQIAVEDCKSFSISPPPSFHGLGLDLDLDLLSRFNEDTLRDCRKLSLWTNMFKFTSDAGLGPPLDNVEGVFSNNGWYATNQFVVKVIFNNRMKQYECLTNDSSLAPVVFAPFYVGFDIGRYLQGYNISVRHVASLDLVDWLMKRPELKVMGGKKHFLVVGIITWDFRRLTDEETNWGNKLLGL